MIIHQGDVYWVRLSHEGAETDIPHPHVVIETGATDAGLCEGCVVVCALTTDVRKISIPGNILLSAGEADLPRPSIVEVSKILRLDTRQLGQYIGRLSEGRVDAIRAGRRFVQRAYFDR